jgi:hypothetical protein
MRFEHPDHGFGAVEDVVCFTVWHDNHPVLSGSAVGAPVAALASMGLISA